MNKIEIFQLAVFCLMFFSCGKAHKSETYCGFNFEKLEPQAKCIKGLKVIAKYSRNRMKYLEYNYNDTLFREDTVIYNNDDKFILSKNIFGAKENCQKWIKISTRISDTTRIFVFKKEESNYLLDFIETWQNDSTIKIQYPTESFINPHFFTKKTLDSIQYYHRYGKIYNEFLLLECRYSEGFLYYHLVVDNVSWRAKTFDEKIEYKYGDIYFDLDTIERKELSMYMKVPS